MPVRPPVTARERPGGNAWDVERPKHQTRARLAGSLANAIAAVDRDTRQIEAAAWLRRSDVSTAADPVRVGKDDFAFVVGSVAAAKRIRTLVAEALEARRRKRG